MLSDELVFDGMGRDILYLPALFVDDVIVPAGTPFILHKDETIRFVAVAGKEISVTAENTSGSQVAFEDWTDESVSLPLKEGMEYELQAWTSNGWNRIATKIGDGQPMEFTGLSSNGLYWLCPLYTSDAAEE